MATDASVTCTVTFTDGDCVTCTARGKVGSYPDVLGDLRAEAVHGFRDIHREVREVHVTDPEPTIVTFIEDET